MWARIENEAVAEIIMSPRSIEVPATVTINTPTLIPDTDPPEYENVATQGPGTIMIPAAAFTAWSAEELAERGIISASYADEAPSQRHYATGATWEIIDGAAVGTRTWAESLVTLDEVIVERARRLGLGFDYDFGDERGVHRIGTTDADLRGWDEVSKIASAAIALGQPSAAIAIITNTGPAVVTALEWQSILIAAGAFRQPIWAASFALQAMDPIPGDYADDAYWQA